jgi:hypothetical protein
MKYRAVQANAIFGQTLWHPQRKPWWSLFWLSYGGNFHRGTYGCGDLDYVRKHFLSEGASVVNIIYMNGVEKEMVIDVS